jgi:hypothetical protein
MVGTAVGATGVKVAGSWVVVIDGEVAGITVSRFGAGWQAARTRKTNNKILFKCKFYPLFDFGSYSGMIRVVLPPGLDAMIGHGM